MNSIRVGDVFGYSNIDSDEEENPFEDNMEKYLNIVTITDIKKGSKGTTYVEYTYSQHGTKYNDKLDSFLIHRTRIKRSGEEK